MSHSSTPTATFGEPSRTITVEPVRQPAAPSEDPARRREAPAPVAPPPPARPPEPVPSR